MGLSDARIMCPDLVTLPANKGADTRFLHMLARWAGRYCPWVGLEGGDGLVLDVTGSAHLFGGELSMLEDMTHRLVRAGLEVRCGLADTRGSAWALARFGAEGGLEVRRAGPGQSLAAIGELSVAALRLDEATCTGLLRLGVRTIEDLYRLPRATVARRFGLGALLRLDQALGEQDEAISPLSEMPHYGVRMSLPEPIGLAPDVMAVVERLLARLCTRLEDQSMGARTLLLTLRRVDQVNSQVELRLARAMRDASQILPLFERGVGDVDAGFGIDMVRLEARIVEPLVARQLTSPFLASSVSGGEGHGLEDSLEAQRLDGLITRLGSRIGLENIARFVAAESHIPERSFGLQPVAYSVPDTSWQQSGRQGLPRPLQLFAPEPVGLLGPEHVEDGRQIPPALFRWRRMELDVMRTRGPERIAPEWWWEDEAWRTGLRDYWQVETRQGWRLWLFHVPQQMDHLSRWFVQGIFA